ncbi:hypothetical protein BOV88_13745 [Solemya velum gill symbiont]|uniref:Uncharacterized protein n=1 Tax=Solemya velum gill symbiont TaxID=2340 RepID=A0A1T2CG86_SOVGS|nr:hypothetical protein BOV88_13745 [Solemya velum gill symbiont]
MIVMFLFARVLLFRAQEMVYRKVALFLLHYLLSRLIVLYLAWRLIQKNLYMWMTHSSVLINLINGLIRMVLNSQKPKLCACIFVSSMIFILTLKAPISVVKEFKFLGLFWTLNSPSFLTFVTIV